MGGCGGLQIDCLLNVCLCEEVFLPGGKTMQSLQSLARARTHARRGNTPIAQRRGYGCVSLQLLRARVDCVRSAWALAASPRIFLRGFIPGVSHNVQRECYSIVYGGRLHKQGRFNSL